MVNLIKFSFLLMLSVMTGKAHAAAANCFCEIGNWPASERGIFRIGCDMWLAGQKDCREKKIVDQNYDYSRRPELSGTLDLKIGYTGHWADSAEMVNYLNKSIRPLLDEGHSVAIENTACFAMLKPELILDFVKSLKLPKSQTLDVIGNQAESVGEWTFVLGKSKNFVAEVSSNSDEVIYPSCKYYQDKSCISNFQSGQSGTCVDSKNQLQKLTCCKYAETINEDGSSALFYAWKAPNQCL